MRDFKKIIGIFAFIFACSLPYLAAAEEAKIFINVGDAQVKKSLFALPPFVYVGTQGTNAEHIDIGQSLFRTTSNDLDVSGLFTFIKPEAFLEDTNKVGLRPAPGEASGFNFKNWQPLGTEFLVRAAYRVIGNDLSLEAYLYHVPTTKLIFGKSYSGPTSGAKRMAHVFANDIIKALTGHRGPFISKLVASRQNPKTQFKEIFTLDWDGSNQQQVSFHNSIAISPTWSTNGDKIAYTAFAYHKIDRVRNADLFVYDLKTGKRQLVSYRKGINSGAAFLPGDQQILLTISQEGSPDIFRMSADGRNLSRLTKGPNHAMNVEPAVSPDGKRVAFSSDRLGRPMLFIMNIDGSGVKRMTFVGKYNSTPAWSPDGKTLAFASLDNDHFDIFTMNTDGTQLKRLTSARKPNGRMAHNESPSWSPDGRQIAFTSNRTGTYQLYIINPDGTNERRITNDSFNWDKPKWSPFLD